MPEAIQNTFAVDFTHATHTRAGHAGLINVPFVNTTRFGKQSIKYNAIHSWNRVQPLLPQKFADIKNLRKELKEFYLSSY